MRKLAQNVFTLHRNSAMNLIILITILRLVMILDFLNAYQKTQHSAMIIKKMKY